MGHLLFLLLPSFALLPPVRIRIPCDLLAVDSGEEIT
jgi:hypothetical protein